MSTLKTKFAVGDKIEVTQKDDPAFGRIFEVLEVSKDDDMVRTEKGWFELGQIAAARKDIQADVDGRPANVTLNGSTGGVQDALIEVPLDKLCYELAECGADLKIAKSTAGRARQAVKDLKEKYEKKAAEIEARGIKIHGEPPQMALAESLASEAAEYEAEDDAE